jgi:hypothetical protein
MTGLMVYSSEPAKGLICDNLYTATRGCARAPEFRHAEGVPMLTIVVKVFYPSHSKY